MITVLLLFQLLITPLKGYQHGDIKDSTTVYVVLHSDESGSAKSTLAYLKRTNKSYNYFIDRAGKIYQLVDPKYSANHAGWTLYRGLRNWNNFSIGICFANNNRQDYTEAQYQSGKALIAMLKHRYSDLTDDHIVRHRDIARFRGKTDPLNFDMARIF